MRSLFVLFPFLILICQFPDTQAVVSQSAAPDGRSAITTKPVYAVGDSISITFTIDKEPTIYLQTCCGPLSYCIDRLDSDKWAEYRCSDVPCMKMCMGVAIMVTTVSPRTEKIDARIGEKGTYRFRFLFSENSGEVQELPSNPFTVD